MNELKVFDFEQQNVRTVTKSDKGYFNLNDVCGILDIKNPRDAKTRLRKDGVVTTDVTDNLGRKQKASFVDEGNLYKLIFQSRKPEAEKFQAWVTDEVLPQIRKQGMFMSAGVANEIMENPQVLQMIAEQVAYINKRSEEQNNKLDLIDNKLEGEYVTPQDIHAIQYAIKYKAEQILDSQGMQLSLETLLDMPNMDVYEQAQAHKKHKEEYRYALGKLKRSILVSLKKALEMKGNAPNNHIKRKNVDIAIQFIKDLKAKDVV